MFGKKEPPAEPEPADHMSRENFLAYCQTRSAQDPAYAQAYALIRIADELALISEAILRLESLLPLRPVPRRRSDPEA